MKNSPKAPSTSAPRTSTPPLNRARLTGPVVGLTLLTLGLVACGGSTPATSTPSAGAGGSGAGLNPDIARVPYVYDGKDHSWKDAGATLSAQALTSGSNDLSAQTWSSASSGWGPIEKNKSNGESGGGDGNTLTLQGKTYTTGLGVHSSSDITYTLNGQCSGFQSDMGVDDEVRSLGSVTFEIWADGTKLYDSGLMTGNSATKFASVNLTGKNQLRLVVTGGGDNLNYDHADWAGATLLNCGASNTTWTTVASEYGSFTLQARSTVRYGAGQSWTQKDLDAGTYSCSNSTFGTDPASGQAKQCQVSSASAAAAPSKPSGTYSGPLVITKGGTYSGNWESMDPNVPAIRVQTQEPVIIENSNIRGQGTLIYASYGRLTVRNVKGVALNPNVVGKNTGYFIADEHFYDLRVQNNFVEGSGGIYINQYAGNPNNGDTLKITGNQIRNTDGRQSNGAGGFTTKQNIVQPILLNSVQRLPNAEIAWNEIINEPGKSLNEESINLYISSGTPDSPILIHDNYIQGAYNAQPWVDTAYAGGGILIGDGTTNDPLNSGYTRVYNNQLVGLSNQSLSIVGGVNSQFYNNRVISSGFLPDGRVNVLNTVGVVIWDINKMGQYATPTFWNNSLTNNYVAVTMRNSDGSVKQNQPWWIPECNKFNTVCNGNTAAGTATLDMEKQEYTNWLSKLTGNSIKMGIQ